MMFVFLILSVALVYFLIEKNKTSPSTQNQDGALEILKVRYAKGEITREEFDQKRKELMT